MIGGHITEKGGLRELVVSLQADGLELKVELSHPQARADEPLIKGCLIELIRLVLISLVSRKAQAVAAWLNDTLPGWPNADSYAALVTCGLLKQGVNQVYALMHSQAPERCEALVTMAEQLHQLVKAETAVA